MSQNTSYPPHLFTFVCPFDKDEKVPYLWENESKGIDPCQFGTNFITLNHNGTKLSQTSHGMLYMHFYQKHGMKSNSYIDIETTIFEIFQKAEFLSNKPKVFRLRPEDIITKR